MRTKPIKTILSLLLTLAFMLQLLPVQVLATELTEPSQDLTPANQEETSASTGNIVAEIPEGRDEAQKEFLLDNGLRLLAVYPEAVHYEKDGVWEEIDNTLKLVSSASAGGDLSTVPMGSAAYQNTAGMWDVRLPVSLSSNSPVEVTRNGHTLQMYFGGAIHNDHEIMGVEDEVATASTMQTDAAASVPASEPASEPETAPETAAVPNPAPELAPTPEPVSTVQVNTANGVFVPAAGAFAESEMLPQQRVSEKLYSSIQYNNIYANTDVRYDLNSNQLKESVIIHQASDTLAGYQYILNAPGMRLELQEDNTILVYASDAEDGAEPIFYMPAPYLLDDNLAHSEDITLNLTASGDNYTLTYRLPRAWMAEEDRAYPVVLDPVIQPVHSTLQISDQTLFSVKYDPHTWACMGAGYSTTYGKARIIIKFDNLPKLTSADVLVGANICLLKYASDSAVTMQAHEVYKPWESATVLWTDMDNSDPNSPDWNTTVEDYETISTATWYDWDITNIAQKWYSTGVNTGVLFKLPDSYENSTTRTIREFYSSDWGGDPKPVLYLTYINNSGLEDYWDYTSQSAGRAGTGSVNSFTGNLVWVHNGLGFSGNRMPVSIDHVYTANDAANNHFGLGYGWRTNYNQRVYSWTAPDEAGTVYYVWEDADGTKHYFNNTGTNTYEDEINKKRILTTGGSGDKTYSLTEGDGVTSYFDASGRLKQIVRDQATDSSITIAYDGTSNRISTITDGAGRVYQFTYSSSNLLTKMAFKGTGSTELSALTYTHSSSNLTRITYPDTKYVSYGYAANHLLSSATDIDGYKVAYTYNTTAANSPNRVVGVDEYDGSTAGGSLDIEYAHNQTVFTDHNGRKEIKQFNNFGSVVSVQDDQGRAQFYQYADTTSNGNGIKAASQLTLSSKLQNTVVNWTRNGNFELSGYWEAASNNASTGSWAVSTAAKYSRSNSMAVTRTANGSSFSVQPTSDSRYTLQPGETYTLSAYVKTTGMSNTGNGAFLTLVTSNGATVLGTSQTIKTNQDWTRLTVTYTHPQTSSAITVMPRLNNESVGTAYFDCVQFEESATASRYNILEDGDFRYTGSTNAGSHIWTANYKCGTNEKIVTVSNSPTPNTDNRVMRMTEMTNGTKHIEQYLPGLSGSKGDTYVLAGWAKGDSVPLTGDRKFGIMIRFYKTESSYDDYYMMFNPDTDSEGNWQYAAKAFVAPYDYIKMGVFPAYGYNMNTVYYDGLQLFKEEFGQSYTYDANGNVTSTIDLQKKTTTYEYANNNLTKMTLPNGSSQEYTYDSYHNVLTATSPEGVVSTFTYDTYGNNTKVVLSGNSISRTVSSEATYTSNGDQLSTVKDPMGNTTTYSYDANTGVLHYVQAPGETASTRTNYSHDSVFRTTGVSKGATTAAYTYENDLLNTITSGSGTVYDFAYGAFDLVQSVKAGSRTLIAHQYSGDGNFYLTGSTYGNGNTVSYTYDELGRNTSKTYEDGDKISYVYDNNGNLGLVTDSGTGRTISYGYDLQNRISSFTETGMDYSNRLTWIYDAENNLASQTQQLNGDTYTTTYTYDEDNRLTGSAQGNVSAVYTYDGLGRMSSAASKNGSTAVVTSNIGYKNPTGSTTTSQMHSWSNVLASGTTTYTYAYDSRGNITAISDGTYTISYAYDQLDQLVRENNQAAGKSWVYTYDNGGNILSKTEHDYATGDLGPALDTISYTYGDTEGWKDLLTTYDGQTLTYDGVGNLTGDGTWNYTWQHGRQLAMMAQPDSTRTAEDSEGNSFSYTYPGAQVRYTYDADGKRIGKTYLTPPMSVSPEMAQAGVPLTTQQELEYHYAGDQLVAITDFGDDFLTFTHDVLGPATVTYGSSTYYYIRNAQGDIVGIANSSGSQVVAYRYDAWGNILDVSGSMADTLGQDNPLRYRGYVYDNETGLYYLTSRYYDPCMGRFINADDLLNVNTATFYNLFAYCDNNPVVRFDPNGHLFIEIALGKVVQTLVAAFVSLVIVSTVIDDDFTESAAGAINEGVASIGDALDKVIVRVKDGLSKAKASVKSNTYESHHIVAQKAAAAEPTRLILESVGIKVNDAVNLVPLKYDVHRRLHTTLYYNWVHNTIQNAYDAGNSLAEKRINVSVALSSLKADLLKLNVLKP